MRLMIDTHLAVWVLRGDSRVPRKVNELISEATNIVFVSDVSVWEVAIKYAKHPDRISYDARSFADLCHRAGFERLPISLEALFAYGELDTSRAEGVHKDPFDRLLVAQAKAENVLLLTHDKLLALYGEPLVQVV